MSTWPGGISAITLFVEDLAASKEFYDRAFGLPIYFEDPNSAVYNFGNTLINLLKSSEAVGLIAPASVGAGPTSQFTIDVDDVDDEVEVAGAGGAIAATTLPAVTASPNSWVARSSAPSSAPP